MDARTSTGARLVGGSLSFDHAADTYDATRALPERVAAKLTDALLAELAAAGADRLLEIGAGTGRIARPLMERGVRVTGVDLAPRMLARLREQLGPQHVTPHLVLGDATRLPLASASFCAALMVHVLHLVSSMQTALAEVRRVLAPGGVFVHHYTRYLGDNPWDASAAKWDELLASRKFTRRRRPDRADIQAALRALGGASGLLAYAEDEERTTPAEWLALTARRVNSWTWEIPDGLFAECLVEYEAWCHAHYGDLDREYVQQVRYELEVWSFA